MNRMGNRRFQKRVIEVTKSDKKVEGLRLSPGKPHSFSMAGR